MNIKLIPIKDINPAEYNPRVITKEEFDGLVESLKTFGQLENLIVNKDMTLISGHQRVNAMKQLGIAEATCAVVDLNKRLEKKLNVLMNSQAISGKYDDIKLAEILEELKLDDDYESLRLDKLEPLDLSSVEIEEDEAPEVSSEPPISKLGEIYKLGRHRVMCGDSTDKEQVNQLMDEQRAVLCIADPPYGVSVNETNWIPSQKRGPAFDHRLANDELRGDNLTGFITAAFGVAIGVCTPDACYYSWSAPLEAGTDMLKGIIAAGIHVQGQIIWVKPNLSLGQADYQWRHEICWYGYRKVSGVKHRWLGGRKNTTVWEAGRERDGSHPTMKPLAIYEQPINNHTKENEIVYDPFLGSGPTLIACEQTDRTCYGIELDPKYVDVIRKRYWKFVNGSEEGWEDGTTNSSNA